MKKIISILMTLLILVSIVAIPVSAATPAKTSVSVNKGDEVVYALKLTVPEKVVGCDFSVYFDSSVLKVKEVADFTGNFDSDEWQTVINPNLKDQVIGNWSILSGVSFDNRAMVTIKFEATASADTNISYYVRYLYPESMQQFTTYDFKCDVTVNGSNVAKDAAPELNVDEPQANGLFVNSVTGNSDDAEVNTANEQTTGGNNGGEPDENSANNSGNSGSGNSNNKNNDNKKQEATSKADDKTEAKSDETTADSKLVATLDNAEATPSQADNNGGIFTSVWFWVIIGLVVVGGGAGVFYFVKKKKASV